MLTFSNLDDAKKKKLIQLTIWVPNNELERKFMEKTYEWITADKIRVCLIVLNSKNQLAAFVDDVSK